VNLKKIGASLLLSAVAIATPFSSAFADDLTYKGDFYFSASANSYGYYTTAYTNSGGGLFKFCPQNFSGTQVFSLYEYDPDNPDDLVDRVSLSSGNCAILSVDSFKDGSNGYAELYVATTSTAPQYATFYD
jgi:hypothetical protein